MRSLSYSALQFGQRAGLSSLAASSHILCQHLRYVRSALYIDQFKSQAGISRRIAGSSSIARASHFIYRTAFLPSSLVLACMSACLPEAECQVALAKADGGVRGIELVRAHEATVVVHLVLSNTSLTVSQCSIQLH